MVVTQNSNEESSSCNARTPSNPSNMPMLGKVCLSSEYHEWNGVFHALIVVDKIQLGASGVCALIQTQTEMPQQTEMLAQMWILNFEVDIDYVISLT